jgi:hypothetical protein
MRERLVFGGFARGMSAMLALGRVIGCEQR